MERRVFRRGLINAFMLLALTHILAASPSRQVGAVATTSLAAAGERKEAPPNRSSVSFGAKEAIGHSAAAPMATAPDSISGLARGFIAL